MNNFEFCSPTDFVFGKGVATQVGPKLKALGATCVMVQYGGGSVVRNCILETVTNSLDEAGLKYIVKGGVRANPEVTFVREAIVEAREAGVDFLFAVGGGSVMDSCKATAAGLCHDGDVWDLFVKKDGTLVVPKSFTDSILPSVTRRSLVDVAKGYLGIEVEERPVKFAEIGEFVECGMCGTAAVISPVGEVDNGDEKVVYGMDHVGPVMKKLRETLTGIQSGEIEDKYGWVHKIDVE